MRGGGPHRPDPPRQRLDLGDFKDDDAPHMSEQHDPKLEAELKAAAEKAAKKNT